MEPRELPNLTIGNRPTMGPDPGARYGQQGFRWLVACSLGLLVAAGVTFSLVAQPAEKTEKPAAAVVQPKDRSLPSQAQPRPAMAPLLLDNSANPE